MISDTIDRTLLARRMMLPFTDKVVLQVWQPNVSWWVFSRQPRRMERVWGHQGLSILPIFLLFQFLVSIPRDPTALKM